MPSSLKQSSEKRNYDNFAERANNWEDLGKASIDGLFYLKSLLEFNAYLNTQTLSTQHLECLKSFAWELTRFKQVTSLHAKANTACQKRNSLLQGERDEEVDANAYLKTYDEIVKACNESEIEEKLGQDEELKRLLNTIESLKEGEVISTTFPSHSKHFECPLSRKRLVEPVKNKECQHVYSRAPLVEYIKRHTKQKKQAKCPVVFCDKKVTLSSIEPDYHMENLLKEFELEEQEQTKKRYQEAENVEAWNICNND